MRPEQLVFFIPILIFLIPIIAILTSHQQKMASMIHGRQVESTDNNRTQALEDEVRRLQATVNSLTLTVESLRDDLKVTQELSSRVAEKV